MRVSPTVTAALGLSIRAAMAAGLAVSVARFLGLSLPIYALIAAVIVTEVPASRTRQLALPRLAGTVLGATLGAAISPILGAGAWEIGLGILAAMFLSHLLRLRDSAKLAGYVCGIVMLTHGDQPWTYAFHRVTETILGMGLALLVSLVPRLGPTDGPERPT